MRLRSFAEMLEQTLARYQNHTIEAAQVLEELIRLAKDLRGIARELVAAVRGNVTIDWTIRENVRAQLRVIVNAIRGRRFRN